jgi:uncharacterized protein (TIGR02996 family)
MSDESALLRAILENPEDDTVRLVYADYLDETAGTAECSACLGSGSHAVNRGDLVNKFGAHGAKKIARASGCKKCNKTGRTGDGRVEYAQFIRAQIERETATQSKTRKSLDGKICKLWLDKVMNRFVGTCWIGKVTHPHLSQSTFSWGPFTATVRRGFVDTISCRLGVLIEACEPCGGSGEMYVPGSNDRTCSTCNKRRYFWRRAALKLAEAHPVTSVRLTCRSALMDVPEKYTWQQSYWDRWAASLPTDLHDVLKRRHGTFRFRTADEANAALADAAAVWLRTHVGLPPLPPPEKPT